MKARSIFLALMLSQLSVIGVAYAQDANNPRGLELNDKGFEAFQAGRFAEAASLFGQAYDIVGDSAIRKNEAIAWFKAKDCDQAVSSANKFLTLDETSADDRSEVTKIVANCKVEIARSAVEAGNTTLAEELLVEAESLKPDAVVRDEIALVRVEIAKRNRAAKNATTTTTPPDTAKPDLSATAPEPQAPRVMEWTLIGVGGGVLVSSVVYHALALGWQSDFLAMAAEGGDSEEFENLRSRVHTARVMVPILYSVGALATAGGVGLLVAYEPSDAVAESPGRVWLGFATKF